MNDRMKRLFNMMQKGSIAVFFSGTPAIKSADQYLPFQVNKNFFYLTGLALPNQALVLIKGNEEEVYLFAETRLKEREKWEGILPSFDALKEMTGINHVVDQTQLDEHIKEWLSTDRRAIFGEISQVYIDLSLADRRVSPDVLFTQSLKTLYPDINILNSAHYLKTMRTIKDKNEIEKIQKAIHITKDAIDVLMQKLPEMLDEHQLHAAFKYEIDKKGAKEAFDTICASGEHAVILHYVENDDVISKDDLVLFDLGAAIGEYNADISRTLPASGTFTLRQKELYQLVLDVQEDIIAWIKPGLTFKAFKDKGRELLAKKAIEIGLIKKEEEIINYYYHGLGHHLGLDVHDPCDYDMVFTPGMIITVEPGIYIAEEGIGIRIEDDILITNDGCQNLSKDIPKQIADIESLMSK
jgi:Xaa-Pro aminopeptidase